MTRDASTLVAGPEAEPMPIGRPEAYALRVEEGLEAFRRLQPAWAGFLARCEADHPFHTYGWLSTWSSIFGVDHQPTVLSAWSRDALVCCLPLHTTRGRVGGLTVTTISSWVNTHSFRSGILCDRFHFGALDLVVRHLATRGRWDLLDLPYLPAGHRALAAFKQALERHGLRYRISPDMNSPILNIAGSWDAFFASLSSSRRQTLRRKTRKLMTQAGARLEITDAHAPDLAARLEACWAVSRRTWKHAAGSSIAADPKRMRFYEAIARQGGLILGLLWIGERPVAFEYNLFRNGTLYNLKLGFDEADARLSPGLVLRLAMLEWAHRNGVQSFDYMGHEQDYKSDLATGTVAHETVRVYGDTPVGRLLGRYDLALKPRLQGIKRRARAWFRRGP